MRDIQHHLASTLGTDLSHETISKITDQISQEVLAWQHRPLDGLYPVIYYGRHHDQGPRRGSRDQQGRAYRGRRGHGRDQARPGHLGPGQRGGQVLGPGVRRAGQPRYQGRADRRGGTSRTRAKRAGECDGLTGLPEAIEATWPQATVQTCVVHLIRAATRFVSYSDRKAVAAALRPIYQAPSEEAAWEALETFEASELGQRRYPAAVRTFTDSWERFTPFLAFPPMVRRVISPPLRGRYPLHQRIETASYQPR